MIKNMFKGIHWSKMENKEELKDFLELLKVAILEVENEIK